MKIVRMFVVFDRRENRTDQCYIGGLSSDECTTIEIKKKASYGMMLVGIVTIKSNQNAAFFHSLVAES